MVSIPYGRVSLRHGSYFSVYIYGLVIPIRYGPVRVLVHVSVLGRFPSFFGLYNVFRFVGMGVGMSVVAIGLVD